MNMHETNISAEKNELTVTRIFDAPVELLWQAWTDVVLLDQWWAPKPWKSQTKRMVFEEGGNRLYAMVGPNGEEHWGLTNYKTIVELERFTGEDAFCDKEGNANAELPVAKFANQFAADGNRTIVTILTEYASEEHLQQIIAMGMKEGLRMAFENLDEMLSATTATTV